MKGGTVLEVMDAEIDALGWQPMVEARAAVAELIDKADFLVEGLSEDGHVAWPARVAMLRAALARCNGGAA